MSYMNPYGPAPHKSLLAQWLEHPTGVPKVIVSIPATSSSGFSLLLRERTLVAAGHVETCLNKLRSGGRSPTKFCRVDDQILSRVLRRKFLSKNGADFWVGCKLCCFRQHYFIIIIIIIIIIYELIVRSLTWEWSAAHYNYITLKETNKR